MRRALVTGAAGFVGSTLSDRLVADGWSVVGIDCLTDYYPLEDKHANLAGVLGHPNFTLETTRIDDFCGRGGLQGFDVVFHQAGQPGVRASWGANFQSYLDLNVHTTQCILETLRDTAAATKFVYASSSSVYGNQEDFPVTEAALPKPVSPYGVTKLAGEHLAGLYASNFGVDTVSLRYFTVYGPRQRPDMATHRLIEAAMTGNPFTLFGDGSFVRDFTFVGDIVDANLAAFHGTTPPGTFMNVCGGSQVSMLELIDAVGEKVGTPVPLVKTPVKSGDVTRTGGSAQRAFDLCGWSSQTSLLDGIEAQVDWHATRSRLPDYARQ